jgi:hypothetical protein
MSVIASQKHLAKGLLRHKAGLPTSAPTSPRHSMIKQQSNSSKQEYPQQQKLLLRKIFKSDRHPARNSWNTKNQKRGTEYDTTL